jgi:hypothetical protein
MSRSAGDPTSRRLRVVAELAIDLAREIDRPDAATKPITLLIAMTIRTEIERVIRTLEPGQRQS